MFVYGHLMDKFSFSRKTIFIERTKEGKELEKEMEYGSDYSWIPATSIGSGTGMEVLPDVYSHTIQVVNVCFIGGPQSHEFVLVDAGMPGSAHEIISVAEDRFGPNSRPIAIILTHGHFDHVGALIDLVHHWNVPVYAHELEIPYLTGKMRYPEPDSSVEGGLVAKISPIFPNEPIVLGSAIHALSPDGKVPHLVEFRWIHTPGHTPGHVSYFRERDGVLIAGDAFITVRQDSLFKVLTQELEFSGPPRYLTPDWPLARESVQKLEALKPTMAITGHGQPVSGETLTHGLQKLVHEFDVIAIPDYGRYV